MTLNRVKLGRAVTLMKYLASVAWFSFNNSETVKVAILAFGSIQ